MPREQDLTLCSEALYALEAAAPLSSQWRYRRPSVASDPGCAVLPGVVDGTVKIALERRDSAAVDERFIWFEDHLVDVPRRLHRLTAEWLRSFP